MLTAGLTKLHLGPSPGEASIAGSAQVFESALVAGLPLLAAGLLRLEDLTIEGLYLDNRMPTIEPDLHCLAPATRLTKCGCFSVWGWLGGDQPG